MDKEKPTGEENLEKTGGFRPASFEKRVAAWVGVVYVVMAVLATTYMIAAARALTNVAPLLLPPAAVGVAIIAIYRERHGKTNVKEGRYFTPALVFLCFLAFAVGLICGLPPLLAQLGIPTPLIPNP